MRPGIDPKNPAFAWRGQRACQDTVLFIDQRGNLAWVPYEALKSLFLREPQGLTYYEWNIRLLCAENRK